MSSLLIVRRSWSSSNNFAWPGFPESIRVYRNKPEILMRHGYHIQFKCYSQGNWQMFWKQRHPSGADSTMFASKPLLERNAQYRWTRFSQINSGLPRDARNINEIRLTHTVQVLYTRKLVNFLKAQTPSLCRFHHVLIKVFPQTKCSISRDQGYTNRVGSTARCPKL